MTPQRGAEKRRDFETLRPNPPPQGAMRRAAEGAESVYRHSAPLRSLARVRHQGSE
jgi:hypothetical protein